MWTSQREELSTDSLTTVMVLAQKLKLHNPVLTAAPGVHEEMCLQITQRNARAASNSSGNETAVDSGSWEKSNTSASASSTPSSVCGADEKNPFLQRKQQSQEAFDRGNLKQNASTPCQPQQHKIDQISTGSSFQKHHLARASSSPQKTRVPSRILGVQRRPLLSQKAVDVDTENDTDTETSNDTEINCTSEDELRIFGLGATSNSDCDDAFESVSDFSAKEDNGKSSGKSNPKSRLTTSCNQKQEILRTHISPSPMTKPRKESVRAAKVKGKPTPISSMTPPNSSSTPKPFRPPHSSNQDLESKFCRFSPQRQKATSKSDADNQSLKTHPRLLGKTQISDRHDDGLGASVDDNDDDDVTLRDARHKTDVPESRKKRNERKKSRNFPLRKQGDTNGSDLSHTSSSSSLSYSPFAPDDRSSPLSQHANDIQHGRKSDQKERLEIGNSNGSNGPADETTDFGQKLNLLQSELVQLRHHDEKLARQFLQIYRDIQILKVQRACLDHQDLLDDAIDEVEDRDRLLDLCDTPPLKHSDSKLRNCGLTKMNICSRRFSCS